MRPTGVSHAGVSNVGRWWLPLARRFPETGLWPVGTMEPERFDRLRENDWPIYWPKPYVIPTDVFVFVRQETAESPEPYSDAELRVALKDLCGWEPHLRLADAASLPEGLLASLRPVPRVERLALVPCHRPADVAMAMDFGIPNEGIAPGVMSGVLRSWEERFGVVPVEYALGWTGFQVVAPPTDRAAIEALAEEVVLFAMDSANQGGLHASNDTTVSLFYLPGTSPDVFAASPNWGIWWD